MVAPARSTWMRLTLSSRTPARSAPVAWLEMGSATIVRPSITFDGGTAPVVVAPATPGASSTTGIASTTPADASRREVRRPLVHQ